MQQKLQEGFRPSVVRGRRALYQESYLSALWGDMFGHPTFIKQANSQRLDDFNFGPHEVI